jgi:hypothetical protein
LQHANVLDNRNLLDADPQPETAFDEAGQLVQDPVTSLTRSVDHLGTIELSPMRKSSPGTPPRLATEEKRQRIAEDYMNMWFEMQGNETQGKRGSTKLIVSELCRRYEVGRSYVFECLKERNLQTLK